MTWLIPFFWTIKVNKIIKAKKIEIITKENRNIKTGDFNDNCEGSAVLADLNGPH
ncbi:MAG: hypothetical protein HY951_09135 [Bacteroidia bacterium]|nr:hypothetical protein [Bacteroidia bacterium]